MFRKVLFIAVPLLLVVIILVLLAQRRDVTGQEVESVEKTSIAGLELPVLNDASYDWIGSRIYQNEALGQAKYLTHWNQGEDFPSMGIGHFIWFPEGVDAPFDEQFPAMVSFVRKHSPKDLQVPVWLQKLEPVVAPWSTKEQFDEARWSPEMNELRTWLEETQQYQARFIVATFEKRWQELDIKYEIKQKYNRLIQKLLETPEGLFAIIDYYNFKGLGTNPRERYQGQGWGLVQVLQEMSERSEDEDNCRDIVEQFRDAAASRLGLRVELSPPERNESRWLSGWLTRLQGYLENRAPEGGFPGQGFRVRPYLQNPDKHALTLSWFSNEKRAGRVMIWKHGAGSSVDSQFFESSPILANALAYHPEEIRHMGSCAKPSIPFLHEVRLAGLEAGTSYHYQVSQDGSSAEGVFQTPANDNKPLRFIVYADSETEPESSGKHAAWTGAEVSTKNRKYPLDQSTGYAQNLEVIQSRQPAFVAIAGDLVQSGGEQRDWDEFWSHNASLAASTVIMPALGNHDYFGGPGALGKYEVRDSERAVAKYKTYFDLPGNGSSNPAHAERYYALNYGVVTLIVLDGTDARPHRSQSDTNWRLVGEADGGVAPDWQKGSEQYEWLIKELKKAQQTSQFTFVMFHGAPWTSGVHGKPPGEGPGKDILSAQPLQTLTPLFLSHGVDAVFSGHDEMYEHSIVSGFEEFPGGDRRPHEVHFYDIGIGGDGLRGPASGVVNPYQVFLAHNDSPEVYGEDGVLKDGGKHYGHLEINIEKNPDGLWQAQLDAVYIFPLLDKQGRSVGFERRLYDDSYILTAKEQE